MPDEPAPSPYRPVRADWRKASTGTSDASGRGTLRAVVLIALLGVAGAITGMYFWYRLPTPLSLVSVAVSEYTDPAWPANPWAERDGQLLRDAFPDSQEAFDFQEQERLVALLSRLHGAAGRPLVLHLSALARVHGGEVHLLPGNAKPDDPATWVKLAKLLDAFAQSPATHKMLLLDLAHPLADPYRGPLTDDVSTRLHALLAAQPRNFLVLASCSAGEHALPMDDEEASAFGYYAAQGLAGQADRYNAARATDSRVSARELAAFVIARVSRWAATARGARQTPKLYGDVADFHLTFAPHAPPEPAAPSAAYPSLLLDGWARRDQRRTGPVHRFAPVVLARLDETLLRAERAWGAGLARKVGQSLPTDLNQIDPSGDVAKGLRPPPLRSLVADVADRPEPAELGQALEKYLKYRGAVPPPKAEEMQKVRLEFLDKAKAQRLDAAGLVWKQLLDDSEPTLARVRDLTALIVELQPRPSEEGFLLRRLAACGPPAFNWPAAEVHALLQMQHAAGRALGLLPKAFPGVRDQLDEADRTKRDAVQRFLTANTQARAREAAKQFGPAATTFTAVREQLETIRDARRAVADAAWVLTGAVPGLVAGDVSERVWGQAADAARNLADLLGRNPAERVTPSDFKSHLATLKEALRVLEAPYAPVVVKKMASAKDGGTAEYQALCALLRGPLMKAPERKLAWEAARQVSKRLHAEAIKLDQTDDELGRPTPQPQPAVPDGAESERAGRRARAAVELLRLIGLEGADRLDAERRAATGAIADDSTLAVGLGDAWVKQRPAQLEARVKQKNWPATDRLSRGPALPGVVLAAVGTDPPAVLPAVQLWRDEERVCRAWLEEHFKANGQLQGSLPGPADLNQEAIEFYKEAAAECRR